ncbi:MAG: site-2 protease family protein [Candidatus Moranbacteria bacterium]|nr:site-2 protease family protein [Candidatus Moranbacteria bacterium]
MSQEIVLAGFYIVILLYSVIIHEVSHGVMALWLGDLTAKYAGRLNLNPVHHIDPIGSIAVPLVMMFTTGFAFGWAKPVPYNPYNLRDQKWGPAWVALAGPASNFLIALIAAMIAKILPVALAIKFDVLDRFVGVLSGVGDWSDRWGQLAEAVAGSGGSIFFGLLIMIIFWNVVLGMFNLLPIPPLDGSKLMYSIFSLRTETIILFEQLGFLLLLLVIFSPISAPIMHVITLVLYFFFNLAL